MFFLGSARWTAMFMFSGRSWWISGFFSGARIRQVTTAPWRQHQTMFWLERKLTDDQSDIIWWHCLKFGTKCKSMILDIVAWFWSQSILTVSATAVTTYLCDLCVPTTAISGCQQLRPAATGTLLVPCARTATGQRSFAVYGPATWNHLPPALPSPDLSESAFETFSWFWHQI